MPGMTVSVVVAVRGEGEQEVSRCRGSLAAQSIGELAEIVWVDGSLPGGPARLKEALTRAIGDMVAVTSARCVFPADWLERVVRAHDRAPEFSAIGGAVEYGGDASITGWAMYFADYGEFMPPAARREGGLLAGNHVSYKRQALGAIGVDGYWKVFFHEELRRQGRRLLFDPSLTVTVVGGENFWAFARRYFRDGRSFASQRGRSLFRAVGTPLLPVVLLNRRVRAGWGKNCRVRILMALPWLAVLTVCWSAGELAGYLAGKSEGGAVDSGLSS